MKIAHLSDLHVLDLSGVSHSRMLNKRLTGLVNLKLRRSHSHHRHVVEAAARALADHNVDQVVVTGDLTNLALEPEFELARKILREALSVSAENVSVVPGNHDAYTRGAHRARRFESYFGEYLTSDLPGASGVPGLGRFPYVRLRGPIALIGLSSAVPRPPLVASGELGKMQRMALHSLLAHDEVRARTPVILQHHPWHAPGSRAKMVLEGLRDADEEHRTLLGLERGLLLHGHLHRRIHRKIETARGHLDSFGSSSASLIDEDVDRMSGFNLYEIDDTGALRSSGAFRFEPATERFIATTIPHVASPRRPSNDARFDATRANAG